MCPAVTKGAGTDPEAISVDVTIAYGLYDPAVGEFQVPAGSPAGWRVNKAAVAKYVNTGAPGGPTGAKTEVFRHCTTFDLEDVDDLLIGGGAGEKLIGRHGHPSACP